MEDNLDYIVTFTKEIKISAASEEEAIEKATEIVYESIERSAFDRVECEFDISKALRDMFNNHSS